MHAHALCRKKLPAEMLCRARGATLPRIGHMHRTHDMHQALRCSQNALAGFAGAAAAHQAGGRRRRPGFAAEPHTPPESAGRCARGAGRTAGEATKCLLHESVLCTATGSVPCACIRVLQRDMILKAYSTKASAQAKAAVVPLVQIMQDSSEDASKVQKQGAQKLVRRRHLAHCFLLPHKCSQDYANCAPACHWCKCTCTRNQERPLHSQTH